MALVAPWAVSMGHESASDDESASDSVPVQSLLLHGGQTRGSLSGTLLLGGWVVGGLFGLSGEGVGDSLLGVLVGLGVRGGFSFGTLTVCASIAGVRTGPALSASAIPPVSKSRTHFIAVPSNRESGSVRGTSGFVPIALGVVVIDGFVVDC